MSRNINHYFSKFCFIGILFTFSWCIEPYDFEIINNEPTLVVESYFSDKSYNETLEFPSDGRYFEVKLKQTSDVTNVNDQPETNAEVTLLNNLDESWVYQEAPEGSGKYLLLDDNFKAQRSIQYKLKIKLANGGQYESSWEALPQSIPQEMGDISFQEIVKQGYVYESGEEKIRDIDGIDIYVNLPVNNTSSPKFIKWDFVPIWVYIAPFTSELEAIHKCWISNQYYLSNFVLQKDNSGNYPQKLQFLETTGNDRIYEEFSLLINQYIMTEEHFNYWDELEEQSKKGGLFDAPPYNLQTNYKAINSNKKVSGYFGIVQEEAKRWYFNKSDLSYVVVDNLLELCNIVYGRGDPGGPPCYSCLEYPTGNSSNLKPEWWK